MYQAQRYFHTLELDKVLAKLADQANCDDSKRMALSLTPSDDFSTVQLLMKKTSDAYMLSARYTSPSLHKLKNCEMALRKAEKGSNLSLRELMDVSSVLHNIRSVKDWRKRCEGESTSLDPLFEVLTPNRELENTIDNAVLSEEELADSASAELASLRRKINQAKLRVRERLDQLIKSPTQSKYLQEALVTQRDGRFVVPVKSEYRSEIKGLVHDTSSSGATLFIEPMAVVEANNEIRVLQAKEKQEVDRIIMELSVKVGEFAESIIYSYRSLVEIDLYFAKASLAYKMKATVPNILQTGEIDLKRARHPLIDPEKVVPIDVNLGKDFNTLVITGPNTGGKTVSLKTVGLLTLMGQSGLHIPTLDRSELALFHEVYADIGDEQSIEQSLSTFSSHMTNIVSFLGKADRHSLVLFDELCSGTDPTEGAALAISILSYLHERGIRTMATTHYSELKVFALSASGIENACCEFNVETLSPTYRLLIGIPGKSNAFAISSKLGIPESIIEKAREQINEQDESFEDVLTSLEESRITIENERTEIAQYKLEIETLKKQLENKQEKLDVQKERIIRQANEEAHKVLQDAKDYADQTMKLFHKFHNEYVDTAAVERERQQLRQRLNKAEQKMAQPTPKKKPKKVLTAKDIHLGDTVRVLSMNLKGTVSTRPDSKGYLFVQMGIIRSKVHISDLELIDEPVITTPSLSKTGAGKIRMSKSASVSTEINLLGKTVDEAVAELDKYLDDAYIAHLKTVRIVHGKGTGALRKGVHNYLKRQKHVASYRLGEFGEGDAGVTIVEFKK